MKLLIVSQYFYPENFRINDIAKGLVERGHAVDVLTSLPNVPGGEFFEGYSWFSRGEKEHDGVHIERVGVIRRGSGSPARWVLNCASFAFNSLFHLPHLQKNGYDAVFVFNNSPVTKILPAKVLARRMRIPNIIYILDIWPDSMFLLLGQAEGREKTLFQRAAYGLSRWLYKSADTLLISSRGFEPKLRAMGLTAPIGYFPNYAEPPAQGGKSRTRASLSLSADDVVLAFAGNVGVAQGLDKLVEAAKTVRDARVKYLIVGDGSALAALRAQVAQAGLAQRFVFTGWVDSAEIPSYLALCDMALVSLRANGVLDLTVPAKLQTYMYAGLPVLAFMNGAGAETVAQANCGFTASAGDEKALAAAIDRMAALPKADREAMGERGRAYCAEHFDRDKLLDGLEAAIEKAVREYKDAECAGHHTRV
ncbi:MAG: glycosyltransferase family 4 protein [Oscillospiraceae bacterium]|nr:glycosyltransferase family 4 protein [Oscillospiraceae bacterium]